MTEILLFQTEETSCTTTTTGQRSESRWPTMTDRRVQTNIFSWLYILWLPSPSLITITKKNGAHKLSLRSFRDVSWGNVLWMTTGLASSAPQSQFESDTSRVDRTRTDNRDDGNANDNWANICVHCRNLTTTIGRQRTWQGGTTFVLAYAHAARRRGRGSRRKKKKLMS